jgi:hypothetical protein
VTMRLGETSRASTPAAVGPAGKGSMPELLRVTLDGSVWCVVCGLAAEQAHLCVGARIV